MLRLKDSVCIDAPAALVWDRLSQIDTIDRWVPAIKTVRCATEVTRGRGAVRVCELQRFSVREEFIEWDEGRSFKYRGTGAPMMKWATNRWSLESYGAKTLVTSEVELVVKGGAVGRLLEPVMALAIRLGLPNSLAPLKFYLETGRPFEGKPGRLPRAPATC